MISRVIEHPKKWSSFACFSKWKLTLKSQKTAGYWYYRYYLLFWKCCNMENWTRSPKSSSYQTGKFKKCISQCGSWNRSIQCWHWQLAGSRSASPNKRQCRCLWNVVLIALFWAVVAGHTIKTMCQLRRLKYKRNRHIF